MLGLSQVTVKHASVVDMGLLRQLYMKGGKSLASMPRFDEIQPSIQALDIVLRHRTSMK